MTNQMTPRQRALAAIWNSEGPDDCVEILADQAAARSESVIDELSLLAWHLPPIWQIRTEYIEGKWLARVCPWLLIAVSFPLGLALAPWGLNQVADASQGQMPQRLLM